MPAHLLSNAGGAIGWACGFYLHDHRVDGVSLLDDGKLDYAMRSRPS